MNQEAIKKMRLAQKYRKEAIMELVPSEVRGNVETIEKEMKEIVTKCILGSGMELMQAFMGDVSEEQPAAAEEAAEKVKKVNIL